jgi:hypothetical protein
LNAGGTQKEGSAVAEKDGLEGYEKSRGKLFFFLTILNLDALRWLDRLSGSAWKSMAFGQFRSNRMPAGADARK